MPSPTAAAGPPPLPPRRRQAATGAGAARCLALFCLPCGLSEALRAPSRSAAVDLQSCSDEFPAFLTYLGRSFGDRHVVASDLSRQPIGGGTGRLAFLLQLQPGGAVALEMTQKPRGEVYKMNALTKVMRGVVERNQAVLAKELAHVGGRNVTLYWRFMGGDCPETRQRVGLPLHGWSSDDLHADIAMPDFTFEDYKNIYSRSANPAWRTDSWPDVSERLHRVPKRRKGFNWRGSMSNQARMALSQKIEQGPPPRLARLLRKVAPDGFDVSLMSWETNSEGRRGFESLYEQCEWSYSFHVPGRHYSAMLKYKLACNQTVFVVGTEKKNKVEFWYDALEHSKNVFFIREDLRDMWEVIEEAFTPGLEKAKAVAAAGRDLADGYLSQHGLDCYVMLYLTRYYFPMWRKAEGCTDEAAASPSCSAGGDGGAKGSASGVERFSIKGTRACSNPDFGECDCYTTDL